MTTREIASEYRLVQWAEKMRDQKDSGQNIRQWCEANPSIKFVKREEK